MQKTKAFFNTIEYFEANLSKIHKVQRMSTVSNIALIIHVEIKLPSLRKHDYLYVLSWNHKETWNFESHNDWNEGLDRAYTLLCTILCCKHGIAWPNYTHTL